MLPQNIVFGAPPMKMTKIGLISNIQIAPLKIISRKTLSDILRITNTAVLH